MDEQLRLFDEQSMDQMLRDAQEEVLGDVLAAAATKDMMGEMVMPL